jgi:4-amino-4-deoxy-L-arabinose transferase-like glycosyltransferase
MPTATPAMAGGTVPGRPLIAIEQPMRRSHTSLLHTYLWSTAIWLLVTLTTVLARPPLVWVELRLHSVAWWLWVGRPDVSYIAGDWPPLLLWLIRLVWSLFGPSEVSARLVASLFGLGAIWLMPPLMRLLWPSQREAVPLAPMILAGSGGFVAFIAVTLPAWPLLFFSMLALLGILLAWKSRATSGWLLLGLALGGGQLAAGPIALLMMLPVAILLPVVITGPGRPALLPWALGCSAALLIGLALALAGILAGGNPPSGEGAGDGLGHALARLLMPGFRLSRDVTRPWLWYVFILPIALYPWLMWQSLWRAFSRTRVPLGENDIRVCLLAAAVALLAAIADGRPSYDLLPVLPPLALVAARLLAAYGGKAKDFHAAVPGLMALFVCLLFFMLNIVPVAHLDAIWRRLVDDDLPIWLGGISLASGVVLLTGSYLLTLVTPRVLKARIAQLTLLPVLLALTTNLEFVVALWPFFDLTPMANEIRTLQVSGRPVAVLGGYTGAFDFAGRLPEPLIVLADRSTALDWARANPDGAIVSFFRGGILHLPDRPLYLGHGDDGRAALWSTTAVIKTNGAALLPHFR